MELDRKLLFAILGLIAFGLIALFTAAGGAFWIKQLIFVLISLGLVLASYKIFELSFYQKSWIIIYWLNIALLIVLKVAGTTILGSQRWIKLGPISIQPSEIAKICLIIALAAWLSKRPIRSYIDIIATLGLVALPAGLVFIQPDLGTTLVYAAIVFGMLFWAGASLIQLLVLIAPLFSAITASIGFKLVDYHSAVLDFTITVPWVIFIVISFALLTWYYQAWTSPWRMSGAFIFLMLNSLVMFFRPLMWGILKEYQQKRLTIFLDPYQDPLGAGYHIIQSLYAIGSGGIIGKGLKAGELTQGKFVPEQHTDFVFSAIGEELGLIGTIAIIALYALLSYKIIKAASNSADKFSSLMCIGIFSMLMFHIFVNLGMNLSLMPITGVPLPFISYGGTSMLVDLFLMSLVFKTLRNNAHQFKS